MRKHLSNEECQARYPRLVRCMKWVAILSSGEAGCGLRDYRDVLNGDQDASQMIYGGGEAVAHFGGPLRTIVQAIKARHVVQAVASQQREWIQRNHAGA